MSEQVLTGGCFCGRVRYRIEPGTHPVANCHCTMCRRTSGAPFVTWLVAKAEAFSFTSEASPRLLESSDKGKRWFCDECGTPVTCITAAHPDLVDVTVGSLDDPDLVTPTMEVFEDTRLPWVHPL